MSPSKSRRTKAGSLSFIPNSKAVQPVQLAPVSTLNLSLTFASSNGWVRALCCQAWRSGTRPLWWTWSPDTYRWLGGEPSAHSGCTSLEVTCPAGPLFVGPGSVADPLAASAGGNAHRLQDRLLERRRHNSSARHDMAFRRSGL